MLRSRVHRLLVLAIVGTAISVSVGAMGQGRPRSTGRRAESAPAASKTPRTNKAARKSAPSDVSTEERAEGEGKVKVFKFTGLDISGRLKSPSLLYFLNRLRAEFDRPRLPHRSFMPELVRSGHRKELR